MTGLLEAGELCPANDATKGRCLAYSYLATPGRKHVPITNQAFVDKSRSSVLWQVSCLERYKRVSSIDPKSRTAGATKLPQT